MKKIFTLALMLSLFLGIRAQDIITLKNGEDISAKITKITDTEIEYKKWENQDGPIYTKHLWDVFSVKHANGDKEVFDVAAPTNNNKQSKLGAISNGQFRPGARIIHEEGVLKIDGQILNEYDIADMFGPEYCLPYKKSIQQYATGKSLVLWGWIELGTSILSYFVPLLLSDGETSIYGLYWSVPLFVGGAVMIPCGYSLLSKSNEKLDDMTYRFNRQFYSDNISLDVNPSMLFTPMPDGNLHPSLGASLTLKF